MARRENWMLALARHYARMRSAYPTDRLLVVFEIDGQIVDHRHTVHPGVLEVIRWFQLQSATFVGLNTSRPERLRVDTLHSLNVLGRDVKVAFDSDLLRMNESGDHGDVVAAKIEGLRAFTRAGYRPIAVIDHDPAVIRTLVEADEGGDILFLQTLSFDLTVLVGKDDVPDQVQLVWHGVNDEANLREFLSSPVAWGECDVRRDPRQRLVLRHDSFERTPWARDEPLLTLATAVEAFAGHGRGLKLDLKEGSGVLDEVLALVARHGFDDDRLWFNAAIDAVGAEGFRRLRAAYPGAIVQCPVDFLAPLVMAAPRRARAVLRMLIGWGISRFSVAWGHEVNLYGVPDHESFLQAVLLLPSSLTADFHFPQWNYYGRGSGERRRYHRYPKRQSTAAA